VSETYPVWSDPESRHHVWLQRHAPDRFTIGGISISGQILGAGEYEYSFLVRPDDLAALCAAFDLPEGGDLADLAAVVATRYPEVREVGDREWLEQHGVPFEFWSRVED
jgi:hypothetical protein